MAYYGRTENYVANLKRYLKDDEIYQDFLKGKLKEISDFDRYLIDHCTDIAMLIEENKLLKQKLSIKVTLENKQK